jgi:hypothetical protein
MHSRLSAKNILGEELSGEELSDEAIKLWHQWGYMYKLYMKCRGTDSDSYISMSINWFDSTIKLVGSANKLVNQPINWSDQNQYLN